MLALAIFKLSFNADVSTLLRFATILATFSLDWVLCPSFGRTEGKDRDPLENSPPSKIIRISSSLSKIDLAKQ